MTKVCIARIRSGTNYKEPLNDIMDAFFECLKYSVEKHEEIEWSFYNLGFNEKPVRDNEALKQADIIIIPSENEHSYHIKGKIHGLQVARSNVIIDEIKPFIAGKKIILLRSDRADDEALYREKTFTNIDFDYDEIDETNFQGNIYGIKYWFIKDRLDSLNMFEVEPQKIYDFGYWGWDKSKLPGGGKSDDQRHIVLKELNKNLKCQFFGRMRGIPNAEKAMKMNKLIHEVKHSKSTLCFNWMSSTATTARYAEALACGIIPFVWKNYDINNTIIASDFLRINSVEEMLDKVNMVEDNYITELQKDYESKILTIDEYKEQFDKELMKKCLKK